MGNIIIRAKKKKLEISEDQNKKTVCSYLAQHPGASARKPPPSLPYSLS